jgi:hypothetical protein
LAFGWVRKSDPESVPWKGPEMASESGHVKETLWASALGAMWAYLWAWTWETAGARGSAEQ